MVGPGHGSGSALSLHELPEDLLYVSLTPHVVPISGTCHACTHYTRTKLVNNDNLAEHFWLNPALIEKLIGSIGGNHPFVFTAGLTIW